MTLTDRTIAGLRHVHDHLADVVGQLTEEQLGAQSGAEEWTVATTLSHMGSGSEINRYVLLRAIGDAVDAPDNQAVWDRWNALPSGRAGGRRSSQHSDAIVATLEGLTEEQRIGTMVDLGFMPQPVPLGTVLGMRINEMALHGWDVEVGARPGRPGLRGGGRPGRRALREHDGVPARLHGQARAARRPGSRSATYTLVVDDQGIRVAEGVTDPSATFDGPVEAASGCSPAGSRPSTRPAGVTVSGNVTLDELRAAFPGY